MQIWVLNPPFLERYSRAQRSPAVTKSGCIYFPMWLAYCVGVLEDAGHDVTFTDAPARGLDLAHTIGTARSDRPAMIVMDTSTPSIVNDLRVADELKRVLPDTFIVLVGTHVTATPDETLQNGGAIDAICRREYDYTVRDLAAVLDRAPANEPAAERLQSIAGLSYRVGGRIVHNPDRPFIEDITELPWVSKVYKKHLRLEDYFNQNALYPMVTLVASRGCHYRCTFCVYPQTITGRSFRMRDITDVVDEMEYVVRELPQARSIFFEDDVLTSDNTWCREFAAEILKRGLKLPWTANARAGIIDYETMRALRDAGCRQFCVGFESGEQMTLNGMKKGTKLINTMQFMDDARKADILVHGCFMVGFPGETAEHIEKTVDFAIELNPDTAQFYPLMVYPGTEAYDEYKDKGWIESTNYRDWVTKEGQHNCVVRNGSLSPGDLVSLCDKARRRFYLRPRYVSYKLRQMVTHPSEIIRTAKASKVFFKHLLVGSR